MMVLVVVSLKFERIKNALTSLKELHPRIFHSLRPGLAQSESKKMTLNETSYMSHSQMLGKFEYTLPAKF